MSGLVIIIIASTVAVVMGIFAYLAVTAATRARENRPADGSWENSSVHYSGSNNAAGHPRRDRDGSDSESPGGHGESIGTDGGNGDGGGSSGDGGGGD